MAELSAVDVLRALQKKGFQRRDTHHIMLRFVADGRTTSIVTRISHGRKMLDDWLLSQMAKQMHLSRQEFLALAQCSISESEYAGLIRARGHLR